MSPAKLGGFACLAGSLLILSGILWLYFAPGLSLGESAAFLSGVFRLAGPLGVALTTAGLLGLYFVIAREGGSPALLWATLGAMIILLSLAGLVYIVAGQPPFSSPTVDEAFADPPLLFTISSALVSWIRPLGILLLAFALVREDILFGRALLLFLLCFLETPIVSNAILYLTGPSLAVEWPVLLFGLPGVQTGIIGALAWFAFGVSLVRIDRE
ncbi:hypothetical protein BH20ACT10_BH20ACT10_24460 [soil metagenome]|jgi:hypothetical protein